MVYGVPTDGLEVKCPGGHEHIKIEGRYTRPSATYMCKDSPTMLLFSSTKPCWWDDGSRVGLNLLDLRVFCRMMCCSPPIGSLLTLFPGAPLFTLICWRRLWQSGCWRDRPNYSQILGSWTLSKGRNSCRLLLGFCGRAAALQIIGGLYPVWPFAPTRLNVADDPTPRGLSPRPPVSFSIRGIADVDFPSLHAVTLPIGFGFCFWLPRFSLLTLSLLDFLRLGSFSSVPVYVDFRSLGSSLSFLSCSSSLSLLGLSGLSWLAGLSLRFPKDLGL